MSDATPDAIRVNGKPANGISPLERGLHFGDGLFETIACLKGRARFIDLHLERLASGCARLRIDPGEMAVLREEVVTLAHGVESAIVKLIVARGEAQTRGYVISGKERTTRIALRFPWSAEPLAPARIARAAMQLGENPALAGIKHLNRLEQVLAHMERGERSLDELLLLSSSGYLASGIMSNVFISRQGKLVTPRITTCGVAGVMRRVVLREAHRAGIQAEEGNLTPEDLSAADEMFLTNARVGIWPVSRYESRELSHGELTRRLQQVMAPLLEEAASG